MMPASDPDGSLLAGALREFAPRAAGVESHLESAIAQAVTSGGSRLRARMALAAARSHGVPESGALQLACAIEYFHVASLLLDDLPCMDDGTVRRGQPCVHRVHGEATAILAALALINRAHVLVGIAFAVQPAARRLQAAMLLDHALGTTGLVGGQAADLRYGEGPGGGRAIGRIAAAKTGALFRLALVLPALAGDPSPGEFRLLKALSVYWGQWFQARDDMQDLLSTTAEAGKDTRRDRSMSRPNLAVELGPTGTRSRIDRLEAQISRVLGRLAGAGSRWDYLQPFQATLAGKVRAA